jgi:hypothetical protein
MTPGGGGTSRIELAHLGVLNWGTEAGKHITACLDVWAFEKNLDITA